MYSSPSFTSICIQTYVADLLKILAEYFDTRSHGIKFGQKVEKVQMELVQAVPLGLILNEAISNAIKHAFTEQGGEIVVLLKVTGQNQVFLSIRDNGRGMPNSFDLQKATTFGMTIIRILSKQLGATIGFHSRPGLELTLEFNTAHENFNL